MRIRTIKPEFFTHEELFELESKTKLPVRLAFIGLWCAADSAGRFKWEPRRLGVSILPYEKADFSRVLDALATRGFIVKYRVGDAWFGCIPTWEKHQIVNNREKKSELPEVPQNESLDASSTREARVDHACKVACKEEGKGKEGNMEGKGTGKERAVEILEFLSLESGRQFRPIESNLIPINARLSEPGVDIEGVKKMLKRQVAIWSGTRMAEFLRPETLFGKSKFDGYYSSRNLPIETKVNFGESNGKPTTRQQENERTGITSTAGTALRLL